MDFKIFIQRNLERLVAGLSTCCNLSERLVAWFTNSRDDEWREEG
jgi:hypothetical protein